MAKQKLCRFKHSELDALFQLANKNNHELANKIKGYMGVGPSKLEAIEQHRISHIGQDTGYIAGSGKNLFVIGGK